MTEERPSKSFRQLNIASDLPKNEDGDVYKQYQQLKDLLDRYIYSDAELNIIEAGILQMESVRKTRAMQRVEE